MTDDLIKELEEYMCRLYGGKTSSDVNALRNEVFWKTFKNKEQVTDLFHLPPCRSSLKLHEATILRKFGDKLIRKSWSMKVVNNMDGMKIIR